MIHFHSLQIQQVRKETDDCVSVLFVVPPELQDTFEFTQGQSLTIRKRFKGAEVRRNYSICSSPMDGEVRIAVKKVSGGIFSTWANNEAKAGDILEVMPPTGNFFTPLHPANKKNYVAFAAGSGITPILSIIKTTLLTEPQSTFTLVYGNRNKASIIFKEALQGLKDKFIHRFRMYHILSRERSEAEINYGRIDKQKCDLLFSKLINVHQCDEFFLCGPEQMIFCVKDFLVEVGVDKKHIHFELFTVPGEEKSANKKAVENVAPTTASAMVTVKLDGLFFKFPLAYEGLSILEGGLAQGADLPFACKGGVCTTCKAKLLEGEVKMDVNWGLEDDEVAKGFILTCQSHPITENVVVDFDVK